MSGTSKVAVLKFVKSSGSGHKYELHTDGSGAKERAAVGDYSPHALDTVFKSG